MKTILTEDEPEDVPVHVPFWSLFSSKPRSHKGLSYLNIEHLEDDTHVPEYSGFNPVCRSPIVSSTVTLRSVALELKSSERRTRTCIQRRGENVARELAMGECGEREGSARGRLAFQPCCSFLRIGNLR